MGFSLGAVALPGAVGATVWFLASRNWLRRFGTGGNRGWVEWLLIAAVPLLGASAYWPFNYNGLLGVGDSYHYTLQVADAVTQAREGHWPIMAGQSAYAFNGNVHTVRTAPYFTHVAAVLDLLGGHELEFWQLTNLVILGTAALGAWMVYVCVRWLAPEARVMAALLAVLYELSPALGTPLMNHDMIATFVATPWLPLVGAAAVQCWREEGVTPWLLLAFALGLTWLAHPPTAIWITPLAALAVSASVFRRPLRGTLWCGAAAVCLFGVLAGYVFYSVRTLAVPGTISPQVDVSGAAIGNIASSWPDSWKPLNLKSTTSGNIQLGYALWLTVLLGFLALLIRPKRTAGWVMFGYFLLLLSLIAPLPRYSAWFWSHVPREIMVITNNWPMQRIFPVLASLAVVFTAVSFGGSRFFQQKPVYAAMLAVLAGGALWSGMEFRKLQSHAVELRRTTAASSAAYRPDALVLTRSSYALFDAPPSYFSHSWMDPEMESRLLGEDGRIMATNPEHIEAVASKSASLKTPIPLDRPFTLNLRPDTDFLFVFTFSRPEVGGEVTLHGHFIDRAYALPLSGQPGSFGSAEISQHGFRLGLVGEGEQTFVLHAPAGTSVNVIPFSREQLPIRVRDLTPYRATVVSPKAGYLETPLMFVPGYTAQIDGKAAEPLHSAEGLVAVPVPEGISNIAIRYPGPPGLRFLGWLATLGGLAGAGILVRGPRHHTQTVAGSPNAATPERWDSGRTALAGALVLAGGLGLLAATKNSEILRGGHVKLAMQLPIQPLVAAEPLLVSGKEGAANTVYVLYSDTTFRIGIDVWGKGGPISEPLPLSAIHRYIIDFTFSANGTEATATSGPLRISIDGKPVLEFPGPIHPVAKDEFYLGRNPLGASVCSERFTGWLEPLP